MPFAFCMPRDREEADLRLKVAEMSIPKVRRVAVIGAGPAGAIATDALVKEQAFDEIRVFERKGQIGGTW
jgi:cation diffusion facilitator CzcD-associated flavoprotein CzcO